MRMVRARSQTAQNPSQQIEMFSPVQSPTPAAGNTQETASDINDVPSTPVPSSSLLDMLSNQLTSMFDRLEARLTAKNTETIPSPPAVPSNAFSATSLIPSVTQPVTVGPSLKQINPLIKPVKHEFLKQINPLIKPVKHEFPKFDGNREHFRNWKRRFIAAICDSELAPLYDQDSDNLASALWDIPRRYRIRQI